MKVARKQRKRRQFRKLLLTFRKEIVEILGLGESGKRKEERKNYPLDMQEMNEKGEQRVTLRFVAWVPGRIILLVTKKKCIEGTGWGEMSKLNY